MLLSIFISVIESSDSKSSPLNASIDTKKLLYLNTIPNPLNIPEKDASVSAP